MKKTDSWLQHETLGANCSVPTINTRAPNYLQRQQNSPWMLAKGKDPTKLVGGEAVEWARGMRAAIRNSGDDYITAYLKMVQSGKTQPEIATWANDYRRLAEEVPGSGKSWWKAAEMDLEKAGRKTIAKELGKVSKSAVKVIAEYGTYVVTIAFLATASDASEQIQAVLPPGADLAWGYAEGKVNKIFGGAAKIGHGEANLSKDNFWYNLAENRRQVMED